MRHKAKSLRSEAAKLTQRAEARRDEADILDVQAKALISAAETLEGVGAESEADRTP